MALTLSAHDLTLLCARWSDSLHLGQRFDKPLTSIRDDYSKNLAETIGKWLAGGMLAWQAPLQRRSAFAPVAWLIGTMYEHDTYLDALSELHAALRDQEDPYFPDLFEQPSDPQEVVRLGDAYLDGAAIAVRVLADGLSGGTVGPVEGRAALHDALLLVQRLPPGRMTPHLTAAWKTMFPRHRAPDVPVVYDRAAVGMKHAFVRALFPVLEPGHDTSALRKIVADFGNAVRFVDVPEVFRRDHHRCAAKLEIDGCMSPEIPWTPPPIGKVIKNVVKVLRPREAQ